MKKTLLVTTLLSLLLVSCATMNVKQPEIHFCSQGKEVYSSVYEQNKETVFPNEPQREGYKFYGWWVTTEKGVEEFSQEWLDENKPAQDMVVNARWENTSYKFSLKFKVTHTQDGVVYNNLLFKFNSKGQGRVVSMNTTQVVGTITLNKSDLMLPHSNAVCFGKEIAEGSSFPLLYSNVYTSYKAQIDRREGIVCVYQITNNGPDYLTELKQIIRIGFVENQDLWLSHVTRDRSPYGNFIIDTDNNKLWAFVTRDENKTTRFFCFDVPKLGSGKYNSQLGCEEVVLNESDIERFFDVPYSYYLQGACYKDGKIYSTEGMGPSYNPPSIRIIDLENGIEDSFIPLFSEFYQAEAEFIDYWKDGFYYSDDNKNVYFLGEI